MPHSVQSLDTVSLSDDASFDDDDDDRLAELEWRESLDQLQQLFAIVLFPYLGKWLGRRWSYWGAFLSRYPAFSPSHRAHMTQSQAYARYVRLGLGMSFLSGEKRL